MTGQIKAENELHWTSFFTSNCLKASNMNMILRIHYDEVSSSARQQHPEPHRAAWQQQIYWDLWANEAWQARSS